MSGRSGLTGALLTRPMLNNVTCLRQACAEEIGCCSDHAGMRSRTHSAQNACMTPSGLERLLVPLLLDRAVRAVPRVLGRLRLVIVRRRRRIDGFCASCSLHTRGGLAPTDARTGGAADWVCFGANTRPPCRLRQAQPVTHRLCHPPRSIGCLFYLLHK